MITLIYVTGANGEAATVERDFESFDRMVEFVKETARDLHRSLPVDQGESEGFEELTEVEADPETVWDFQVRLVSTPDSERMIVTVKLREE